MHVQNWTLQFRNCCQVILGERAVWLQGSTHKKLVILKLSILVLSVWSELECILTPELDKLSSNESSNYPPITSRLLTTLVLVLVLKILVYFLCIEILITINFFYNFDHSSYSKNYTNIIYFVCYMLYYYKSLSLTYHFIYL
jgi:hypothetical protein